MTYILCRLFIKKSLLIISIMIVLSITSCSNRSIRINGVNSIISLDQTDSILKKYQWNKRKQTEVKKSDVIWIFYRLSNHEIADRVIVRNDSLIFHSMNLELRQDTIQSISYISENDISLDEAISDAIKIYNQISTVYNTPKVDNLDKFKTRKISFLDIAAPPVAVWHTNSHYSVAINIFRMSQPDKVKVVYLTELVFEVE